jgi:CRISPR-associated protein Cas2
MIGSPYQIMWLITMFDLPTANPAERREYQKFHGFLIKDGFSMMQYSVYMRFCASPENLEAHLGRIKENIPPEGEVRIVQLTSKQFERMIVFQGKMRKEPEKEEPQLCLF